MARRPRRRGGAFSSTMTSITDGFRIGDGGAYLLCRTFRWSDSTCGEHIFNPGNDAFEQARLSEYIAARDAHLLFRVVRLTCSYAKGQRHDGVELVYNGLPV